MTNGDSCGHSTVMPICKPMAVCPPAFKELK